MPEPMEILSGTIGTNSPDRVVPATGIFICLLILSLIFFVFSAVDTLGLFF